MAIDVQEAIIGWQQQFGSQQQATISQQEATISHLQAKIVSTKTEQDAQIRAFDAEKARLTQQNNELQMLARGLLAVLQRYEGSRLQVTYDFI